MAERIRLSRAKGWRLPKSTINVARPGRWGNPFVVGRDGTRMQCAVMFLQLARGFIDLGNRHLDVDAQIALHERIRLRSRDLKGRDLACWCPLDGGACHGDVLLSIANGVPAPAWMVGEIELPRVRLGMLAKDLIASKRKAAKRGMPA